MVADDFGFRKEYEESPSIPSKRDDKIDIELEHLVDEKLKEWSGSSSAVEHGLPKPGVAGSKPVSRFIILFSRPSDFSNL